MKQVFLAAGTAALLLSLAFCGFEHRPKGQNNDSDTDTLYPNVKNLYSPEQIRQLADCQPFETRKSLSIDGQPVHVKTKIKGKKDGNCLYFLAIETDLFSENIECVFPDSVLSDYTMILRQAYDGKKTGSFNLMTTKYCHIVKRILHDFTKSFRRAIEVCRPEINQTQILNNMIERRVVGAENGGCRVSYAQYPMSDSNVWKYGKVQPLGFACVLNEEQRRQYVTILQGQTQIKEEGLNPFSSIALEDEVNFFIDSCRQAEHLDILP